MKSNSLAVAVVRLQVPELHDGHRYLLNAMTAIHRNVLVVIGETEARLTVEDPLPFEMRRDMLKSLYPNVIVDRLSDVPDDQMWSDNLDALIYQHNGAIDPDGDPTLYGGRDSFIQYYKGDFRTFVLPTPEHEPSGTEVRAAVEPRTTADFRAGVVWASKHKYPTSFQCVDAAILHQGTLLVGQKKRDGELLRFIGGFVSTKDASLEAAVRREVAEETGVEVTTMRYVGSMQVDDFRYPTSGTDRLMTAFFVANGWGVASARDDISYAGWRQLTSLTRDQFVPEHRPLFDMLVGRGLQ